MSARFSKPSPDDTTARTEMLERELGSLRKELEALRNRHQPASATLNIMPIIISCVAILLALFALIKR